MIVGDGWTASSSPEAAIPAISWNQLFVAGLFALWEHGRRPKCCSSSLQGYLLGHFGQWYDMIWPASKSKIIFSYFFWRGTSDLSAKAACLSWWMAVQNLIHSTHGPVLFQGEAAKAYNLMKGSQAGIAGSSRVFTFKTRRWRLKYPLKLASSYGFLEARFPSTFNYTAIWFTWGWFWRVFLVFDQSLEPLLILSLWLPIWGGAALLWDSAGAGPLFPGRSSPQHAVPF